MQAVTEERLLTSADVAKIAGVSPETVQRWAQLGDIRAIRVGRRGRYRFRASEIMRLLSSEREGTAA